MHPQAAPIYWVITAEVTAGTRSAPDGFVAIMRG